MIKLQKVFRGRSTVVSVSFATSPITEQLEDVWSDRDFERLMVRITRRSIINDASTSSLYRFEHQMAFCLIWLIWFDLKKNRRKPRPQDELPRKRKIQQRRQRPTQKTKHSKFWQRIRKRIRQGKRQQSILHKPTRKGLQICPTFTRRQGKFCHLCFYKGEGYLAKIGLCRRKRNFSLYYFVIFFWWRLFKSACR